MILRDIDLRRVTACVIKESITINNTTYGCVCLRELVRNKVDYFLYSGDIARVHDLTFIEFVAEHQKHSELMLILSTHGGQPSAAYKIGRYLQLKYENIAVFVPGFCKSAGTLLAIAASELVFSPYGELGPLDIQIMKPDKIVGLESGLNIDVAFNTLENRAKLMFHDLVIEIIGRSGGAVSFQTASHSASEIVSSLFGPISARIDPEEVGSRARALQICEDYGIRLNGKFRNLKEDNPDALKMLSGQYHSHDFVIDIEEAKWLFNRVRESDDSEKDLIKELAENVGEVCRVPEIGQPKMLDLGDQFRKIKPDKKTTEGTENEEHNLEKGKTINESKGDGEDFERTSEKERSASNDGKPVSSS